MGDKNGNYRLEIILLRRPVEIVFGIARKRNEILRP
jgi:hypothetical protein